MSRWEDLGDQVWQRDLPDGTFLMAGTVTKYAARWVHARDDGYGDWNENNIIATEVAPGNEFGAMNAADDYARIEGLLNDDH